MNKCRSLDDSTSFSSCYLREKVLEKNEKKKKKTTLNHTRDLGSHDCSATDCHLGQKSVNPLFSPLSTEN